MANPTQTKPDETQSSMLVLPDNGLMTGQVNSPPLLHTNILHSVYPPAYKYCTISTSFMNVFLQCAIIYNLFTMYSVHVNVKCSILATRWDLSKWPRATTLDMSLPCIDSYTRLLPTSVPSHLHSIPYHHDKPWQNTILCIFTSNYLLIPYIKSKKCVMQ